MKDTNEKESIFPGSVPEMLRVVVAIAKEAGAAIMNIYGTEDFIVEYKDDSSPLTIADKSSHEIIIAGLQKHFPNIPSLSEEGKDIPYEVRKNWKRFWLVDPLDGTKEFINRNGEFTVNIALIENQIPILGVVYAPAQDKMYYGEVGLGAFVEMQSQGLDALSSINERKSAKKIKVRRANPKDGLSVVMSRSHPSPELDEYLKGISIVKAVQVGSSLKFSVVAEGIADLYPRFGPTMEWDTAAGHAIVISAGGRVVTPEGLPLVYNKQSLLNPYFLCKGTTVSQKDQ